MKAVALFSGGLDSSLAIKLIISQGIDVLAVNISTGFGLAKDKYEHMQQVCEELGAELRVVNIEDEYLEEVLFNPKHGYGKYFNPCIDCHTKMFTVARKIMVEEGASFLISGEVLGQREMSQNKEALQIILNDANCDGLLLRPLSALELSPTIAEKNKWVNREELEGIVGRSRERQLKLSKEFGLKDTVSEGCGCLLSDEHFGKKMNDFIKYDTFTKEDIPVMRYGRHFRLEEGAKLVVSRNKDENRYLQNVKSSKYMHLRILDAPGPHVLLSIDASPNDIEFASRAILTYAKTRVHQEYKVSIDGKEVTTTPFASREDVSIFTIV